MYLSVTTTITLRLFLRVHSQDFGSTRKRNNHRNFPVCPSMTVSNHTKMIRIGWSQESRMGTTHGCTRVYCLVLDVLNWTPLGRAEAGSLTDPSVSSAHQRRSESAKRCSNTRRAMILANKSIQISLSMINLGMTHFAFRVQQISRKADCTKLLTWCRMAERST